MGMKLIGTVGWEEEFKAQGIISKDMARHDMQKLAYKIIKLAKAKVAKQDRVMEEALGYEITSPNTVNLGVIYDPEPPKHHAHAAEYAIPLEYGHMQNGRHVPPQPFLGPAITEAIEGLGEFVDPQE
jgi:hypothetical protein